MQAITALTQRFDTFLERMGERDVQREQRLTRLEGEFHSQGRCATIVEIRGGQVKHDERLRALEITWGKALGGLALITTLSAAVATVLAAVISG